MKNTNPMETSQDLFENNFLFQRSHDETAVLVQMKILIEQNSKILDYFRKVDDLSKKIEDLSQKVDVLTNIIESNNSMLNNISSASKENLFDNHIPNSIATQKECTSSHDICQ